MSAELGGKRHKYTKFDIKFLSACPRPAQEGATALVVAKTRDDDPTPPTPERAMADPNDKITQLTGEVNTAKEYLGKLLTLTGAQFDVFKSMPSDRQNAFLAMMPAEREAEVKKYNDVDPIIGHNEGRPVRKSQDPFGLMAQMEAMKKQQELTVESQKAVVYKARAQTELAGLPLSADAGIDLLVALDGVKGEKSRGEIVKFLSAVKGMYGGLGTMTGVSGGGPDLTLVPVGKEAAEVLKEKVEKYMADKNVTKMAAYNAIYATDEGKKLKALADQDIADHARRVG